MRKMQLQQFDEAILWTLCQCKKVLLSDLLKNYQILKLRIVCYLRMWLQLLKLWYIVFWQNLEFIIEWLVWNFQKKLIFIWESRVLKIRFLLGNIRHTKSLKPGMFFFNLHSPPTIGLQGPPLGSCNCVGQKIAKIHYVRRTRWSRIQGNLIKLAVVSQTMKYTFLTKFRGSEWMANL